MYRCPRCNNELPANARFCTKCGFNQTNARMTAVASQPVQPGPQPPTAPSSPAIPPEQAGKHSPAPSYGKPGLVRPVGPAPKGTSNPSIPVRPSAKIQTPAAQAAQTPMAFIPQSPAPSQKPSPAKGRFDVPIQKVGPAQPQSMPKGLKPQPQQPPATPITAQTMQPMAFQPAAPSPSSPQQGRNEQPSTTTNGRNEQARQGGLSPQTPSQPARPQQPQRAQQSQQGQQSQQSQQGQSPQLPTTPFQRPNTGGQPPMSAMGHGPAVQNMPYMPQTPSHASHNIESLAATSKAAEHWRNSWLDRQRAEAGPAVGITRGQAVVAEPLLVMQQSLARMRAIVFNQNKAGQKQGMGFSFWFAIVMICCLVIGLGTYIISTYIPNGQLQTNIALTGDGPIPLLTIQGKQSTVAAGQLLHLHGDHFGAHHPITFYLDNTQLQAKGGTTQSSASGAFDVVLTIAPTTLAGSYVLEAVDNQAGKHAFVNLQVLPATIPPNTTSLELLSRLGKPLTSLTFGGQANRGDPHGQNVTLHNTSNTPLAWTATTITDNGVNWLTLDNADTSGQLDSYGSFIIGVHVLTTGLKSGPYTGHIVFTVNNDQQVIFPVTLQLTDISNELVISPSPIIAIIQAGGTCLPDTTLTLINLSGSSVNWDVKGDGAFNQQHIHFDGQVEESNTLLAGDTKVLNVGCVGVQLGMTYHITVYYNGQAEHIPITVRTA